MQLSRCTEVHCLTQPPKTGQRAGIGCSDSNNVFLSASGCTAYQLNPFFFSGSETAPQRLKSLPVVRKLPTIHSVNRHNWQFQFRLFDQAVNSSQITTYYQETNTIISPHSYSQRNRHRQLPRLSSISYKSHLSDHITKHTSELSHGHPSYVTAPE